MSRRRCPFIYASNEAPEVGDTVRPAGVPPTSADYDVGRVSQIGAGVLTVEWEVAEETYNEEPINLVLVQRAQ